MNRCLPIAFAFFSIFLISLFGYALTVGPNDIQKNAVRGKHIKRNSVMSSDISKGAVRSSDIRDGGIKAEDLAEGAVDTAALGNEAVTNTKIAFDAVDTPELADGAVTKQKLGSDVTVQGLTGVALVGVADFATDGSNSNCFFENDGYWQKKDSSAGICCLQAPVHPPHGVRFTGFEGMFMDDDPSVTNETTIELEYKDIRDASGNQGLATLFTSEVSTAFQIISDLTLNHVVDAVNYQYYVGVCVITENQRFYGARAYYEPVG